MEKISVTVRIPALGGTYDFIVPGSMAVRDVQQLMMKILVSEYGVSDNISDLMLFGMEDGKALRSECSFAQLGVSDGAKLLLI